MDLVKLRDAFDNLNRSTERLMTAYDSLKEDASRLTTELEESRNFLTDILNSLHCAVVVTDLDGKVALSNPQAMELRAETHIGEWFREMATSGDTAIPRLQWRGGGGMTLVITRTSLKRYGKGVTGYIFIIEDETELSRLRDQSRRADRLSAIGRMAAGMAHEIRNPLGGMEIFASLLARELAGDDEKLRLLRHINTGIQSINNVISNFLLFTKEPTPARKEFDLKQLAQDILEFTAPVFDKNKITVIANLPDAPMTILADPDLLRQVVLNMIQNSVQAMPDGGEFRLTLQYGDGEETRAEILCEDTGPGVPADIRDRIFDPFFTTKDSGAGLGLAIVSQIAQAHGGYVELVETGEPGARFIISIPAG